MPRPTRRNSGCTCVHGCRCDELSGAALPPRDACAWAAPPTHAFSGRAHGHARPGNPPHAHTTIQNLEGEWRFRDSWRTTFALHARPGWRPCPPRRPLAAQGFHSEFVYRSWLCAHLAIDPAWLETENVPRRAGLTREQFREEFEIPNRPVIITDGVRREVPSRCRTPSAGRPRACCLPDARTFPHTSPRPHTTTPTTPPQTPPRLSRTHPRVVRQSAGRR